MTEVGKLTFLWPTLLWLLLVVPALIALYLRLLARRRKAALRYANLTLAGVTGASSGSKLKRHLPPALLVVGLCALILAVARPQALVALPAHQETVILAMDVSGSMRASDIKPNRLAAAQDAAKAFIAEQPRHVRIGVVAIAAAAAVVQSPTTNREDLLQAIDRFQLQRGSAIGSGLIIALATLLPDAGIDVEQIIHGRSSRFWRDLSRKSGEEKPKPVPPGSNTAAVIVLLSDGQSNVGPDPLEAAKLAAERGVRIFTVGIGTVEGTTLGFEGWSMRVRVDEDMLKRIATMTAGEYFQARNAADLKSIYSYLNARLTLDKKRSTEVTAIFVAIGATLAALGALLSVFWFGRIL